MCFKFTNKYFLSSIINSLVLLISTTASLQVLIIGSSYKLSGTVQYILVTLDSKLAFSPSSALCEPVVVVSVSWFNLKSSSFNLYFNLLCDASLPLGSLSPSALIYKLGSGYNFASSDNNWLLK